MNKSKNNLTEEDRKIVNLLTSAKRSLKESGRFTEARKMTAETMAAESYEETVKIVSEYIEIS